MIPEFSFDPPVDDCPNRPFPDEIARDPWVLYHGTSGLAEPQIESQGLCCSSPAFEKPELEAVDSVFESLQWNGRTAASRAVLNPFTLGHDFGDSSSKPTYFAECAYRALTFATRDFAGGEAARALRYSFDELWEFLNDEQVSEPHLQRLLRESEEWRQYGVTSPNPAPADLEDVRRRLESLDYLRSRAIQFWERHPHGVVYAVRFQPADLDEMSYHNSMGVKCFKTVPSDRIVGKTRIPSEYAKPPFLTAKWLELPPFSGIIQSLRESQES